MATPKKQPQLDLSTVGQTGLPVWGGRVYDEVLLDLQGERGRRILREMSEQDPIIGGILLGIEMLSRQVPWSVTPADETKKAKEVADFVDECLTDMNPTFGNTLSEILSMLIYGWSWLEVVYKRRQGLKPGDPRTSSRFDDSKIGWSGWHIRSQETLHTWQYSNEDGSGDLVGLNQNAPPAYHITMIPRNKSLHFKTRSRRENPEGISILRNCWRPWYMKKNIEQIEGIGIERDLAGLPVMWAPAEIFSVDASPDQKNLLAKLQKLVTSIKRDEQEGVLMPMAYMDDEGKQPSYKLELLSTGGDRQFDTNAIINRYDERIAMSMLADFILMGHQAVGSFALSTTKTGLFSTALSAIMDVIAEEINMSAIPMLVRLNGFPLNKTPSLQHGKIEAADLSKLGEFLKQLADAGMAIFPNLVLEKHLLEQAGLPSDPGAGQLPMPQLDPETGLPIPPAPGQLPANNLRQLPLPQPAPAPAPAPAAPKPAAKVASEPEPEAEPEPERATRKQRHFVPLSVRMSKIREQLTASMDTESYRELLDAVMDHGKFSQLTEDQQESIRAAEEELRASKAKEEAEALGGRFDRAVDQLAEAASRPVPVTLAEGAIQIHMPPPPAAPPPEPPKKTKQVTEFHADTKGRINRKVVREVPDPDSEETS